MMGCRHQFAGRVGYAIVVTDSIPILIDRDSKSIPRSGQSNLYPAAYDTCKKDLDDPLPVRRGMASILLGGECHFLYIN